MFSNIGSTVCSVFDLSRSHKIQTEHPLHIMKVCLLQYVDQLEYEQKAFLTTMESEILC